MVNLRAEDLGQLPVFLIVEEQVPCLDFLGSLEGGVELEVPLSRARGPANIKEAYAVIERVLLENDVCVEGDRPRSPDEHARSQERQGNQRPGAAPLAPPER